MKKIIPYVIINDKCEEALNFYVDCFDGQIIFCQKYSDTDYVVSDEFRSKIAHAEFKADHINFYLSDGFEDPKATIGNNIAMSVNFDNQEEQKKTIEKIIVGGEITMPLSETSVGSKLMTLIDKFGIHWYLNYSA